MLRCAAVSAPRPLTAVHLRLEVQAGLVTGIPLNIHLLVVSPGKWELGRVGAAWECSTGRRLAAALVVGMMVLYGSAQPTLKHGMRAHPPPQHFSPEGGDICKGAVHKRSGLAAAHRSARLQQAAHPLITPP